MGDRAAEDDLKERGDSSDAEASEADVAAADDAPSSSAPTEKGGGGGTNSRLGGGRPKTRRSSSTGKARAAKVDRQAPPKPTGDPVDESAPELEPAPDDGDSSAAAMREADSEASDDGSPPATVSEGVEASNRAADQDEGDASDADDAARADEPASTSPDEDDSADAVTGEDDRAEEAAAAVGTPEETVSRGNIELHLFGKTDVGQIREHNEDNFLLADLGKKQRGLRAEENETWSVSAGGLVLAVCDGMGGAAAGEVASQMATDLIHSKMLASSGHGERDRLALDVVKALEEAGKQILAEAMSNRSCRGMGTTATVAAVVDDQLLLGQVGDSRAYILRGGRLVQVTRDQSLVNQLIEAGQLTEEEAENFEHSNIILQALGTADTVQVDLTFVELRRGDVLMMCSDGLSGMLRDSEIRELLVHAADPVEACRVLIEEANLAGGHDNISVIVGKFGGSGLPEPDEASVASLKYSKYGFGSGLASAISPFDSFRGYDVDDSPSIEVHGEFEVEGEVDWDQVLAEERLVAGDASDGGVQIWMWALGLGLLLLLYLMLRS